MSYTKEIAEKKYTNSFYSYLNTLAPKIKN